MTAEIDRDFEWLYSDYTRSLLASAGLTHDDFVALQGVAESDTGRVFVWTRESFTPSPVLSMATPNLFRVQRTPDGFTNYWFNKLS